MGARAKFSLRKRLRRTKEDRFFFEVLQKEVLEERVCETTLTIFHRGLRPFRINKGRARVAIQLMLDFFSDIVDARKDDEEPVMMVLSYLPTAPRVREKEEFWKKSLQYFATWTKEFKGIDIKSLAQNERKNLQAEYLQKYEEYYDSLRISLSQE